MGGSAEAPGNGLGLAVCWTITVGGVELGWQFAVMYGRSRSAVLLAVVGGGRNCMRGTHWCFLG